MATDYSDSERVLVCVDCENVEQVQSNERIEDCSECGGAVETAAILRLERAKGMWDDVESIDDMVDVTETWADRLRQLKDDGWRLDPSSKPVTGDYAYLRKPVNGYTHDELPEPENA